MDNHKIPSHEILFLNNSMKKTMKKALIIDIIGAEDTLQKMLVANVKEALNLLNFELGRDVNIRTVTDWQDIMDYNIIQTPALMIRKQVLSQGFVPSVAGLQKIIKAFIPDEQAVDKQLITHN